MATIAEFTRRCIRAVQAYPRNERREIMALVDQILDDPTIDNRTKTLLVRPPFVHGVYATDRW